MKTNRNVVSQKRNKKPLNLSLVKEVIVSYNKIFVKYLLRNTTKFENVEEILKASLKKL